MLAKTVGKSRLILLRTPHKLVTRQDLKMNVTVFGEFDGTKEEWTQYVECLKHFFVANDIAYEGKKRAVLLSVVAASTYALLQNLVSPVKPGEKSYTALFAIGVLSTQSSHWG